MAYDTYSMMVDAEKHFVRAKDAVRGGSDTKAQALALTGLLAVELAKYAAGWVTAETAAEHDG
jgi:hypothetical protein